jgi:DHA2 family multidrug resistance protein
MVLSFQRVFFLAGLCLLCVIPLLYFLKVKKHAGASAPHIEMEM